MADLTELITLAEKGFTAEQITDMLDKAKDVELPVEEPTPEPIQPTNDNTQELEEIVKAQQTMIESLSKQMGALTTAIQANAIINSQQPSEPTQTQSTDDILASLINPQ